MTSEAAASRAPTTRRSAWMRPSRKWPWSLTPAAPEALALLGISGAAAPAIAYAVRHPERVSHLVLMGSYTHGLLHREPSADSLAFHEATVRLVELGWGRADPAVQQFFTTRFAPEASPAEAAALNEQQRLSCDGRRAAAILRARAALDVRALLPQLKVPTLVLHSAGDAVVPVELGREMAAAIPRRAFRDACPRATTTRWPASLPSSASANWSRASSPRRPPGRS